MVIAGRDFPHLASWWLPSGSPPGAFVQSSPPHRPHAMGQFSVLFAQTPGCSNFLTSGLSVWPLRLGNGCGQQVRALESTSPSQVHLKSLVYRGLGHSEAFSHSFSGPGHSEASRSRPSPQLPPLRRKLGAFARRTDLRDHLPELDSRM